MALYVNKLVSVNEFIIMLKERLFPHDDNIGLEDKISGDRVIDLPLKYDMDALEILIDDLLSTDEY